MRRRLWLSIVMLVTGTGLLAGAGFAGNDAGQLRKGGIFRVGTTGASVQVDPQLAYITTAWWLEYATAAKLYNYPDRSGPSGTKLIPEVASTFTVSNGGKTYTFTIRKGFKFSDGSAVTANNFKYAINRVANHELASPGAVFIVDPNGSNIVGAKACNDSSSCTNVSGATVKGNKLKIRLTKADGTFMSKITMPFFQATSTKMPLKTEVVNIANIRSIPAAGPYAYSRNDVNTLTSIRQNPFWKAGPGKLRPRNLTGLDIQWNLNEQTAFNQTKNNELDEGPLPAAEVQGIANQYGVNKTRFWTKAVNCTGYLPMNIANDLFKGNANLRKAINYAVDRRAYSAQAGAYAGEPWSHLLNPTVPGWRNEQPYPVKRPNLAKARRLAAGHFRDGKITVYYRSSGTINPAQAQIVRQDLINLGFQAGNITMKGFSGGNIYDAMGVKGNDADIGVSMGWCSDYPDAPDAAQSFSAALYYSYMNSPKWQRRIDAAAKLAGQKRNEAFGQLDLDIMRQFAPVVVERLYNNRYFFSARVNPKSLVYQGIYSDWSIPALALK
ncbi:MAG: ABC transporter substrate-binding protein [Actinomycetota bacterium]